ncbi:unnamed protein product [Adineta steineri]|uniref:Rho-GAP domain-containing protein n=1 Tax=Adineta steineri TaxID=433720 RepID=A0A819B6P5_9BILA|nr:unnamed protein product [Adineta steineri]
MNNQPEEHIFNDERLKKQLRTSHSSSRKSRSISRYFLGTKRSSLDVATQEVDISRCLTSVGIFDSCDLWTNVTLFHDYRTCRRLFILTNKNELIIGKSNPKQSLFRIKHRININRLWLYTELNDYISSEITSLTYYDHQRTFIIGWPLVENFLVEFDTKDIKNIWHERIQSALNIWQQLNTSNVEHVRVLIDQNQEPDQNNNNTTTLFVIRKVISIRPQETVRDLIKKCIDTSHLQDSSIDNYVLYVLNDANITSNTNNNNNNNNNMNQGMNSSLQLNQTQLIPLIGHEYPYAIKMKHLKTSNNTSFDGDDHLSLQSHHNSSTNSLNNVSINSHDFELRKRDTTDNQNKKHRFFNKKKSKDNYSKPPIQQITDDYHLSSTQTRMKSYQFFGQKLEDLIKLNNNQLPPIIQQLLEILYYKGPDTTGIFRKVANTRSVKESIEKIERNILLQNDDLHPILAAGIFKHFLRTLPEPVFSTIQYDSWKKCLRLPTLQEKITFARRNIISTLAESDHLLLKGFICILYRISQHADTNGMNPFNLGLCVSNSLFKTESTSITSGKQEADVMSSIVEFLIVNSSSLFGSDVITCIPDKHIIVHQIPNLTRPTASSIESLDEVESSPHLLVVNRSRDSGLATSDQPLNDDSSEISEHFRRLTPLSPPDWTSSIACGHGTVITSIILPTTTSLSITRCRNLKNTYKPSKHFMAREKLTNDTTDDSDRDVLNGDSSVRSSTTTVNNMTTGKIKRTKPISRHSSLGSNEHHNQQQQQQQQQNLTKESKRLTTNDVKRASSLKQFHRLSDEGDDDDEQNKSLNTKITIKKKVSTIIKKHEQILPSTSSINSKNLNNERRPRFIKSKNKTSDDESMTTRSTHLEQQDLDLTSEPLSTINQRFNNSIATRSASFSLASFNRRLNSPSTIQSIQPPVSNHIHTRQQQQQQPPTTVDGRSRHNGPLIATTNQIYMTSRYEHHNQTNSNTQSKIERDRIFIHHSDSRPFKLGTAIQMKPIDDVLISSSSSSSITGRCRPCHRQNALRYKMIDQEQQQHERPSRSSTPVIINQNRIYASENSSSYIPRYQSIERRISSTPPLSSSEQPPIKGFSFDMHTELRPCDISWSVREKAKLFEHTNQNKLSTGRENYV